MRICAKCGNQLNDEKFCTKCGAKAPDITGGANHINLSPNKRGKHRKALLIISLCLIVCAGAVAALAFSTNGNMLLGRWELVNDVSTPFDELELFSDNTYASDDSNYNGEYSVDGDRIIFEGILVSPISCTYKVDKNTLTITYEEDTWEFQRMEGTTAPSGNSARAKKKLQGRWELANDASAPFDELELFSNGEYSSDDSNYNGQYSVDGDRIKFEGILVSPVVCTFSISDNTLTLVYDEDDIWEFEKVE